MRHARTILRGTVCGPESIRGGRTAATIHMGRCLAQREDPFPEEEGLFPGCIALLSTAHVLVDLRSRQLLQ